MNDGSKEKLDVLRDVSSTTGRRKLPPIKIKGSANSKPIVSLSLSDELDVPRASTFRLTAESKNICKDSNQNFPCLPSPNSPLQKHERNTEWSVRQTSDASYKESMSWDNILSTSTQSNSSFTATTSHELPPGPPTSPFPVASTSENVEFPAPSSTKSKLFSRNERRDRDNAQSLDDKTNPSMVLLKLKKRNVQSAGDVRKTTSQTSQHKISKPFAFASFKQFRVEVERWRKSKSIYKLQEFYRLAFDSFGSINDAFQKTTQHNSSNLKTNPVTFSDLSEHFVNQKFVSTAYDVLTELPTEIHKFVLKGTINCLLNEWKSVKSENDVRAYFILLQNPLFNKSSTYVVYAHLLRQIATLPDKDQIMLTQWLRRLSTPRFRCIIDSLHQFVTLRLFPSQGHVTVELPPMAKCVWWIPSAVKCLSFLNNSNNLIKPRIVSFREFYNICLDHIDVLAEFKQWQNRTTHPGFTFCNFPFVLSLASKHRILQRDQKRQMMRTARDEIIESVRRRPTRVPDVNQLFCNIVVRREHLLRDSLEQICINHRHLKKKLRIEFVGEPGYDMGGLTKEWFLLLLRQILSPDYGTFVHYSKTRVFWFSTADNESYADFFLIGVLMGLAMYNSITLDLPFPVFCYKKLLSPATIASITDSALPISPSYIPGVNAPQQGSIPVGLVPVSLDDLRQIDPDMAHGLDELLSYEGDVENDLGLTFEISKEEFGVVHTYSLKPGGDKIPVTKNNRKEYVQLFLTWFLNKAIFRQFCAFYYGFHTVCDSSALALLRAEEVETLICGNSGFDLHDLKKHTTYQGFTIHDPTILHFWDVCFSMSRDLQKKLLLFCTGSDRMPVGGMQELNFKIVRAPTAQNMLPMAHTCFNQLILPPYGAKSQLEQKLIIAISNAEGFGLE